MGELETGCLCSVRNGDQDISKANPAAAEAFLGNFKIKWRELKNFLPLWSQAYNNSGFLHIFLGYVCAAVCNLDDLQVCELPD